MKKSTVYLLALILIVCGISAYNMKLMNFNKPSSTKSEYTDYFPSPKEGDLYILKTAEDLRQYFKIDWIISADSFGLIYGKENITAEEAANFFWGKAKIENDLPFEEENPVYINFQDLKDIFESENFVSIYRYRQHSNSLPWYLWLTSSFFGFPAIAFVVFLIIWIFSGLGQFFHYFLPKIPARSGYYLLVMLSMFLSYKLVNNPVIFPDFWVAGLYAIICGCIPFFIYWYLNKQFWLKKEFADREVLKFLTLCVGGIFFNLLAFSIGHSIYVLNPEWKMTAITYNLGFKMINFPTIFIWTAIATGNFLNNLRQNFNQLKVKEGQLLAAKQKELSSQAELDALQARINPHFLYNALNSIASLAQVEPQKTEKMAMALSQFYKYSTNRADEYLVSVGEEVEILKTYLEIEKIRFGDRLQFEIDTENLKKEWKIPRFLLQPLAENAVKYGYDKTTNQIFIKIEISDIEKQLIIKVLDSGAPFSENMKIGYGLSSIQKKLELLFPDNHRLEFINQPDKKVVIEIK